MLWIADESFVLMVNRTDNKSRDAKHPGSLYYSSGKSTVVTDLSASVIT